MAGHESENTVSYLTLLSDPRVWIVLFVATAGTIGALLPPALPAIASGLRVEDATIGYVITAYKLPSILVIPIAAAVADVYGRRVVLLPSLVLLGVAGSLMFTLTSFSAVLVFALLLGVGAATVFPLSVTLLGDFFQNEENSAVQGIRVGFIGLIGALVPALTGYLADIRWNYPFLLFLLVFPIIAIVYVFLDEPVTRKTSDRRLDPIIREYVRSISNNLSNRSLAILLAGGFIRGFSRYALMTFVPLFAVSRLGASLSEAGLLLSIRGAVIALVAPFAGELVSRFNRKGLLVASLSASGLSLAVLPLAPDIVWLGVLVGCHTLGDATFDPVNKGTVTAMAHREYRAGIVNTLYILKRIGQTSSPVVFALILSLSSYRIMFVSAGLVVAVYVTSFFLLFSYEPVSG